MVFEYDNKLFNNKKNGSNTGKAWKTQINMPISVK